MNMGAEGQVYSADPRLYFFLDRELWGVKAIAHKKNLSSKT